MRNGGDGDDLTANPGPRGAGKYRLAYGEAYRIAGPTPGGWGVRDRSFVSNRDRVRDVRLEALALARDIGGRLGVDPESILDAVANALEGRRPRW